MTIAHALHWVSWLLNAASAISALVAAYYWHASTQVPIPTTVAGVSVKMIGRADVTSKGMEELLAPLTKASSINKTAAKWSGIAASLVAVATIISGAADYLPPEPENAQCNCASAPAIGRTAN